MRYLISIIIATGIAICGQLLSFGIIEAQWKFIALTMGYGAILAGFPFLNLIPMLILFPIGLALRSWSLILSLPIFFALVAVPATVHRVTIAEDFRSVQKQYSDFEAEPIVAPDEITVFVHGEFDQPALRNYFMNSRLQRVVIAVGDSSKGFKPPNYSNRDFQLSKYRMTEWQKRPAEECASGSVQPMNFLTDATEAPCTKTTEVVGSLPTQAFAEFKSTAGDSLHKAIAVGTIDTGRIQKVARFKPQQVDETPMTQPGFM